MSDNLLSSQQPCFHVPHPQRRHSSLEILQNRQRQVNGHRLRTSSIATASIPTSKSFSIPTTRRRSSVTFAKDIVSEVIDIPRLTLSEEDRASLYYESNEIEQFKKEDAIRRRMQRRSAGNRRRSNIKKRDDFVASTTDAVAYDEKVEMVAAVHMLQESEDRKRVRFALEQNQTVKCPRYAITAKDRRSLFYNRYEIIMLENEFIQLVATNTAVVPGSIKHNNSGNAKECNRGGETKASETARTGVHDITNNVDEWWNYNTHHALLIIRGRRLRDLADLTCCSKKIAPSYYGAEIFSATANVRRGPNSGNGNGGGGGGGSSPRRAGSSSASGENSRQSRAMAA